jgi:hypothetical protein
MEQLKSLLEKRAGELSLTFKRSAIASEFCVFATAAAMMVNWRCRFANTTEEESALEVSFWAGHPPMWGVRYIDGGPDQLGGLEFEIDLAPSGEPAWRPKRAQDKRLFSVESLANEIVSALLDREQTQIRNK